MPTCTAQNSKPVSKSCAVITEPRFGASKEAHLMTAVFFFLCSYFCFRSSYLFFYEVTSVDSSPVMGKPELSSAFCSCGAASCVKSQQVHPSPQTQLMTRHRALSAHLRNLLQHSSQPLSWSCRCFYCCLCKHRHGGRVNRWKLGLSVFKHGDQAAERINTASSRLGRGVTFWSGNLLKARPVRVITTRSDKQPHSAWASFSSLPSLLCCEPLLAILLGATPH